ncbi:MAG: hypothetical protein K0S44_1475 [Bacteroidetes bacterium]|jgi:uncharacterized protein YfeS|nr:hypothetical protein [Bacteroidota bacterium]
MENYELSPETAHPKAKQLLTEDFYWSSIEESGPFGSDDGSDAFYGFKLWRSENKAASPIVYLERLLKTWDYPYFDLNEMDTVKIKEYISAKSRTDSSNFQMPEMTEEFKIMAKNMGMDFDENKLKEMMALTSNDMGGTFLLGIDNAVIAIGFGQFVLEGKIDNDIKTLTQTAIKRELLPLLIDNWGEYKKTRLEQLNKMLTVVDKMNK